MILHVSPKKVTVITGSLQVLHVPSSGTGAPKLINSDLFLEKRAVARFSRNKSLLISFGAPVVQAGNYNISDLIIYICYPSS